VLPHLRAPARVANLSQSPASSDDADDDDDDDDDVSAAQSSDEIWERQRRGANAVGPRGRVRDLVHVTQWMPVVGSLPAPSSSTAGPPPFIFGLSGLWR
jgi:hypothetical protein